jgi:hypothetical protein
MRYAITFIVTCLFLVSSYAQNGTTKQNGSAGQDGSIPQAPDAFVIGAGTGALDNLGANDLSYQLYGGKLWNANDVIGVKAVLEATTDFENAILGSALLGANIYPVKSSIAPYIGAAAGIGYANGDGPGDIIGLDLAGTFGLSLLQKAPIQVNIEGNANFLMREINGSMPMTFTGRVGILF